MLNEKNKLGTKECFMTFVKNNININNKIFNPIT